MKKLLLAMLVGGLLFSACSNDTIGPINEEENEEETKEEEKEEVVEEDSYLDIIEEVEEFYNLETLDEEIKNIYLDNGYSEDNQFGETALGFYKNEPNSDNYITISSSVLVTEDAHKFFYYENFEESRVVITVINDRVNSSSEIQISTGTLLEDSLIEHPTETGLFFHSGMGSNCSYKYDVETEEYEITNSNEIDCVELEDTSVIDEAIANLFEKLEEIYG